MTEPIYKVCGEAEWQDAIVAGSWLGSADDRRDGFIHFSLAHQLKATIGRYFAGRADLRLISFDPAALGPSLRYEPSRNGELFPHLYSPLDTSLALAVRPVVWVDGQASW
jgi:uncharacterized protein (DUF952 family)